MTKKIGILLILCTLTGFGCKTNSELVSESNQTGTPASQQQTEVQKKLQVEKKQLDQAMQTIAKTDADFDGLSDEEEKATKTDPTLTDTDADGITDFDEVRIHKTDPLKPDSDGDGKSDGYETRRGQNPLKK